MKRRTLLSHVESLDRRIVLAATPVRVRDFPVGTGGSFQHEYAEAAGAVFFFASDDPYGSHDDLWKTDGTPGGTVRVKDFGPNTDATYVQLNSLTAAGGRVFFTAPDTVGNFELWTSDGTDAGTHRVKDIIPGGTGSFPYDFFNFNGTLLFSAETPGAGRELWKSDGTEQGTVLVRDIAPGEMPSNPGGFTAFNGKVYFSASDGVQGGKLWVTDGTEAGTLPVWTSPPGPESLSIVGLRAAGDNLFFVANAPAGGGFDLWRTDGTAAGTVLLREGFFGGTVVRPRNLTDVNGILVFVGDESEFGTELWKSDGTVAGTTVLKDIVPRNGSSNPDNLVVLNDTLYFAAFDANNHRELWKTDGTEAGTVKAVDVAQRPEISDLNFLTAANGALYFAAASGPAAADRELWKSDGTAAGTARVADIAPGPFSSNPEYLFAAANKVFFTASRTPYDREPWVSDGTDAGTVQLADINTTPVLAYPENLIDFNGTLFFSVGLDPDFRELWKSDGTAAGTRRVSDVLVSTNLEPVVVNGSLFFKGFEPATGWEVWKTDGTDAGTVMVNDTTPGANAAQPFFLFNNGGTLLFSPGVAGVWKSDGTAAGTVRVSDAVNPTTPFVLSKGVAYFGGNDAGGPTVGRPGLWRTDGTPAGTYRIGSAPAPSELVDVNGTLYFNGTTPDMGTELWKSDGTAAGTTLVKDIVPGSQSSYPMLLRAFGDKLMFFAWGGPNRLVLWRSDGTAAGTIQIGPDSPQAYGVAVVGDTFYFTAYTGVFSLWKYDGTTSSQVKAFDRDMPRELTNVNGALYFTASTPGTGVELWKSDGTEAGTVLVGDLAPGQESSYPSRLTVVGGRTLFFDAGGQNLSFDEDPALWKLALDVPPAVVGRHVFYNHSSFDGGKGDANAADDSAIAPDKFALLPGGVASFANVTSFNKGINGVMVDIAGLPAGATLTADDFEIGGNGTPPASVTVRRGAGAGGSDRVTLTWPDYNPLTDPPTMAVGNGWLRVTVKANQRTGLAAPDVFSFGNLIGEVDDAADAAGWRVNALDLR